jgi:hypothetical protein
MSSRCYVPQPDANRTSIYWPRVDPLPLECPLDGDVPLELVQRKYLDTKQSFCTFSTPHADNKTTTDSLELPHFNHLRVGLYHRFNPWCRLQ